MAGKTRQVICGKLQVLQRFCNVVIRACAYYVNIMHQGAQRVINPAARQVGRQASELTNVIACVYLDARAFSCNALFDT